MDISARALLAAERMVADGRLAEAVRSRYQGWSGKLGKEILEGTVDLEALSRRVLERNQDVAPVSGRQELLENLVGRSC